MLENTGTNAWVEVMLLKMQKPHSKAKNIDNVFEIHLPILIFGSDLKRFMTLSTTFSLSNVLTLGISAFWQKRKKSKYSY